nr:pectate lyase [Geofilum rhodophaeum]
MRWSWMLPLVVLMGCSGNDDDLQEPDPGPGDETELPDRSQIPSFPGAEGGGMYTLGGAGGDVYVVSTLEDTFREGSLRHAVSQFGARTIVFAVNGTIRLNSPLRISRGDLTIAGQTAPGAGITLRDQPVVVEADNVVIRFLRFRLGDVSATEDDAVWGRGHKNIIIDHCSMSWSTDECASFYNNENFTLQWSLIAESLNESVHDKGAHGYGGLWGGYNASFHHNLLAHHKSRNPRFYGVRDGITRERAEMVNNVIYNWGDNSAYGGEDGQYNIINNYYKAGPATTSNKSRIFQAYKGNDYGRFYVSGNYVEGYPSVSAENWAGIDLKDGGDKAALGVETPFSITEVNVESAEEAYVKVLDHVGMSIYRDLVDARIIEEVSAGTATYGGAYGEDSGIIDSQETVGGWPDYDAVDSPLDSDGDGMPDAWESTKGLNPDAPEDGSAYGLSDSYTNLEVYLNELVKEKIGFGY